MAAITELPASRDRKSVRKTTRHNLRIDMTPMVDLGFLLIAFFIVTAQLAETKVAELNMPHDGDGTKVEMSNVLTVLIGDRNDLRYYEYDWETAVKNDAIVKTSFDGSTGLRKVIREKRERVKQLNVNGEGAGGMMVIIKPGPQADYTSIIDVLDEILINDIKKYALLSPNPDELARLK